MDIALLLTAGVFTILLGRFLFGHWFNHVSLYGVIWTVSLSLFEERFIFYYPLSTETWTFIGSAWLAFVLGSCTVVGFQYISGEDRYVKPTERLESDRELDSARIKFLGRLLWILNGIITLVALQHWFVVLKVAKSVFNVFFWGNLLYQERVQEGIPGAIPYLDALGLTACLIGGAYVAFQRRLKIVAILPLLIVIAEAIAAVGRAKILVAGILFASGFFLTRGQIGPATVRRKFGTARSVLSLVFVVTLLVFAAEVIRSNRGINENFWGMSKSLHKLSTASFITPSIYLYLTVHHGVFNQYLKKEKENGPWGQYTFAPVWRFLSKLGFDTYIAQYQPFYRTPIGANTGTYLRELHADFGPSGVIFGPYLIGAAASIFWFRWKRSGRLLDLALLGHVYVIIVMSFLLLATMWGYWLVSFVGALALGHLGDRILLRTR